RLLRAAEVFEASGVSLTDWQARTAAPLAEADWAAVVVEPGREALYARCDARLDAMLAQGALEEVRALIGRGLPPETPAMKAVGAAPQRRGASRGGGRGPKPEPPPLRQTPADVAAPPGSAVAEARV